MKERNIQRYETERGGVQHKLDLGIYIWLQLLQKEEGSY